jgi:hypothetical protein
MRAEDVVILVAGISSLLWLRFVLRGPSARRERKLREARARFRRSLVGRRQR